MLGFSKACFCLLLPACFFLPASACLPACLPAYLPACLPTCLPACLRARDPLTSQLKGAIKQVASIREEYRRYRVKAELARKQREAEVSQMTTGGCTFSVRSP